MGALILRSSSGTHYLKDKMMLGLFCISALIAVTAGQAPPPPPPGHVLPPPPPPPSPYGPPRPGYPMPMRHYGRPPMGPFGKRPGGGIDPLTLMMLQGDLVEAVIMMISFPCFCWEVVVSVVTLEREV